MTTLTVSPPALISLTSPVAVPPCLAAILTRVATNVLVACLAPAALFYATMQIAGMSSAILVALAWGYGALAWRRATGRPVSGLLVLTVSVLTLRSVFTLSTGDSYVYFLQPLVTDAALAAVFLVSATFGRPVVSRLATDFYPMSAELASRPGVRLLFTRLTVMWGAVCLLRSAGGFWMLNTLSVSDFVLVKEASFASMTILAVAITVGAGVTTLRKEQLLGG